MNNRIESVCELDEMGRVTILDGELLEAVMGGSNTIGMGPVNGSGCVNTGDCTGTINNAGCNNKNKCIVL
jgi:hypothetical protein